MNNVLMFLHTYCILGGLRIQTDGFELFVRDKRRSTFWTNLLSHPEAMRREHKK